MFPARVAVRWFVPADVAIGSVEGTAWTGRASEASVNGVYLRDIRWSFMPSRLFTGNVAYIVSATPASGSFKSEISANFGGDLELSNLTASLPLNLFAAAAGVNGLQGSASLTFAGVKIVAGLATVADGDIQVENLVVPLISGDSLGAYSAVFSTQDDGILAVVDDKTDGVVNLVDGTLHIKNNRSFAFVAQIVAKPAAPESEIFNVN